VLAPTFWVNAGIDWLKNTSATRLLPPGLAGWDDLLMDQDDPEKRIADLEHPVAAPRSWRAALEDRKRAREGHKHARREALNRVEQEAGVSPAQLRAQKARRGPTKRFMDRTMLILPVLGIAVFIAGLVLRHTTSWIWIGGLALFFLGFVPTAAWMVDFHRKVEKVRWLEGTVTFRTVEPGANYEGSQGDSDRYYDCEVELTPTGRITWVHADNVFGRRETTRKGIVVGATMRCLIDRTEQVAFRAFPWAEPHAPLPSGKKLLFLEGKSGESPW
jgi:hypothetical protein